MELKYLEEDEVRPSFTFTRTIYCLVSNDELNSSADGMKRMLHVVKAKASV